MQRNKVKCEICGQYISLSNVTKHIRRHENHPETFAESVGKYKLNHDGLTCQFCGKECKNRNSLCNHERLCKENPDRQLTKYEKYGPNGSIEGFNNKGRSAWNKGLTKETDVRIAKAAELLSIHQKGKPGRKRSAETKEKISKKMKAIYSSYYEVPRKNYKYGRYHDIWCDSSWELAYILYCQDHNIKFERNKLGFKYIWNDSVHTYFPDFYLPEIDTYIEIKGRRSKRDDAKQEQFNYNLKVLNSTEMKPILDYVIKTYGKDFIKLYDE